MVRMHRPPLIPTRTPEAFAAIFSALSDPVRVQMIQILAQGTLVPCTLFDETFPIGKSTISYHIKVLWNAGLIDIYKDGRYHHYQVRRDVFEHYLPGWLDFLAGQNSPASPAAEPDPALTT